MFTIIRRIYDWMESKVESKYANVWLFSLFFIESSVFIIPIDPLLILYCISNMRRVFSYAALATIASVLGGAFGYLIGAVLWESLGEFFLSWIISPHTFDSIVLKYKIYQHWAVLIAGFTPVPYKAVTISAGFCGLPFLPFVFYSLIARGARFFLVATAIKLWGPQIKAAIDRYFNQFVVVFGVILAVSAFMLK